MSSEILRRELLDDPLARAYAGMTDAVALADIIDETQRSLPDRNTVNNNELYDAVTAADFASLTVSQADDLKWIYSLGDNINISPGSKALANLLVLFPGSGTRDDTFNALVALRTNLTTSRAKEIRVKESQLTESGIAAARIPDQPPAFSFVDGDVNVGTDQLMLAKHPFVDAVPVTFTTTGVLPAGLALATTYFVKSVDADNIELYSEVALTNLVDITAAAGGGNHVIRASA